MKKRVVPALLFFFVSGAVFGAEKKPYVRPLNQRPVQQLPVNEVSKSDLWLGLGAGLILGFGSGQAIEKRWSEAGWPFTVVDGVSLAALLFTFGDCLSCSSQENHRRNVVRTTGAILFWGSRLVQVGELLIYGIGHGMFADSSKSNPARFTVAAVPVSDGGQLAGVFRF